VAVTAPDRHARLQALTRRRWRVALGLTVAMIVLYLGRRAISFLDPMAIRRRSKLPLALALVMACGDGTGPDTGTGVRFVAGNAQTDTVDAILTQALIVEVRDSLGRVAPGQIVRFQARLDSVTYALPVLVAPLEGQYFGDFVADSTDAAGRAGALIRLGPTPGTARVFLTVPVYGYVDTATFTIEPGSPWAVFVEPADTLVSAGASYQLRAFVGDRHSNPRTDPVTYQALDAVATVSPSGLVTAQGQGRGRIVASAAGARPDTSWVGIIPTGTPAGTIVATHPSGIAITNLDGSGYQTIPVPNPGGLGRYPTWINDTLIAAMDGQSWPELLRVTTSGTVTYVLTDTTTNVFEDWPQVSRDGAWIYFAGKVPNYSTSGLSIWRIRPDGTDLERVSPPNTDGQSETCPSPSPDGSRVVATTTRNGPYELAIIDVATQALTPLGISGIQPRWAPAGDSIAFLSGAGYSEVWIAAADGGGARRVSPDGRFYAYGIEWTPDLQWLIARSQFGMELIHVATGYVQPLTNLAPGLSQPAWKP
jgi:hypothetical protein